MSLLLHRILGWRLARRLRRRPLYFSTLTCPVCNKRSHDQMPGNASVYFYDCMRCGTVIKPMPRMCCVYCSYGDVPCPTWQRVGTRIKDEVALGQFPRTDIVPGGLALR